MAKAINYKRTSSVMFVVKPFRAVINLSNVYVHGTKICKERL